MIKRIFLVIVLVIGTTVGLLYPLIFSGTGGPAGTEPTTITLYQADYRVSADGELTATETITVSFPRHISKRGIFRFFDTADQSDPRVRLEPVIESIERDGKREPYTIEQRDNRYVVARIGDENVIISPGEHVYTIRYRIPGVIAPPTAGAGQDFASSVGDPAGARSAFYWDVVARGWAMSIARADVTVQLPSAATSIECSAAQTQSRTGAVQVGPCDINGQDSQRVTVRATNLAPYGGMTVRTTMDLPAPERVTAPWSLEWDPVLGRNLWFAVLIVVLAIGLLVVGIWLSWTARERKPGYPVMYGPPTVPGSQPPEQLSPAQTLYMKDETVGPHGLTSTLFYLADRGVISLERTSDKSWVITRQGTDEQWQSLDTPSRKVATALGLKALGSTFTASRKNKTSGSTLLAARTGLESETKQWALIHGYLAAARREKAAKVLWYVAIVLAIAGFVGIGGMTLLGLPPALFAIGAVGVLATGVGTRRTSAGRKLWSQSGGFERMLGTPSSQQRFDFAARKDLFISFIPYAVGFGLADKWAEKYRAEMGEEPPMPTWYPYGYAIWATGYGAGSGLGDFESTISASISHYHSQTSSGGGGGYSGGIGGGGGGGGGGSW